MEEYTDCESLFEFIKKTILVLMKTSKFDEIKISKYRKNIILEAATIFLILILFLPIIMMGIGK